MTRLKLSDMLFTYIGMAVDVLEFAQTGLGEGGVICSKPESSAVAFLVLLSLVPLTCDLDPTFSGSRRKERNEQDQNACKRWWRKLPKEVKIIILLVACQDLPFMIYRIYLINKFPHDRSDFNALVFFTIKNFMVLMLQGYRSYLILCRKSEGDDDFEKDRGDKSHADPNEIS